MSTSKPVQIGDATLYLGDCLEILPTLGNVDAVVTDPPYHDVLSNGWDNQWKTDAEFLKWAVGVIDLLAVIITSNGSLYWFTSPQMSARMEMQISKKFRILNNLVWDKSGGRKGAAGSGVEVGALRSFWTATTERIVFAEHHMGDSIAAGEAGYTAACEGAKVSVFGSYLRQEFKRAGAANKEIAKLFPSKTGGLTGCVSNWLLGLNIPTGDQYTTMARYLNKVPPSDYLRKDYDYLRKDYDDLRKDYDYLRRPFNLTASGEWGDVWGFKIEREREHEAQKPLAMIRHMVKTSSRFDDTILDPFMGSGTTGVACAKLGRRFIGIEIEPRYFDIACRRIEQAYAEPDLFIEPPKPAKQEAML